MSINEMESKIAKLPRMGNTCRRSQSRSGSIKDEIKAEMLARNTEEMELDASFVGGLRFYQIALIPQHSKRNIPKCISSTPSRPQAADFLSHKKSTLYKPADQSNHTRHLTPTAERERAIILYYTRSQ